MDIHRKLGGGLAAEVERLLKIDGAAIKSARKAAGISQAGLAEISGTKQSTVHRIECGETPRSKFLPQVVRALGGYIGEVQRDEDRAASLAASAEDRRLAEAFRHLENMVSLLAGAAALVDLAANATIRKSDRASLESAGLRVQEFPGWHFYALTPERTEALHHALNHMQDVVKEFDRQYFATLKAGEVAA